MTYQDRSYPVHRYDNNGIVAETDAKVFGSGFVLLSHWYDDGANSPKQRTILIDPDDIERLELALKEARRRRNSSARRRRKKLERERIFA